MSSKGRNIIVIGTSAGGLDALDELVGELPTDIPASIFIVQPMAPENTAEALLPRLGLLSANTQRRDGRCQEIDAVEQWVIVVATER